jgi:transposase
MTTETSTSNLRQERGKLIALDKRIKKIAGTTWAVPSQSNDGAYLVNTLAGTCSCPDHETRRCKCKHMWAVEMIQSVETAADGSQVVTESIKITRKTYSQDWANYTEAQCEEKETVQTLLRGLCDGIQNPEHKGRGPKPLRLSDAVYGMTMKVYTGMSGRRATTDIKACAEAGHMAKTPRFNTLFEYMERPEMTALLTKLIEDSAAPLASIETKFAVDSTGFGTCTYRRWFDAKYGHEMSESVWLKAHAMVGVKTGVVTAVRVSESNVNDCPELPALLETTTHTFAVAEVSADKGYLSRANLEAVEAAGAVPYVPFKSNSKEAGPAAWRRLWGCFMYRQDEFQAHYHLRSNVESVFSSIKRKFGGAVRSKKLAAQTNEVLCKLLCYNLSILVQAMHELGVQPTFTKVAA